MRDESSRSNKRDRASAMPFSDPAVHWLYREESAESIRRANFRAIACSNNLESRKDDLCNQAAADVLSVDDKTQDNGGTSAISPSRAIQMFTTFARNSSALIDTTPIKSSGSCQCQPLLVSIENQPIPYSHASAPNSCVGSRKTILLMEIPFAAYRRNSSQMRRSATIGGGIET